MRRNRKAKIVATLGPASSAPDMISKLFMAGVDVFRLNFSHGTHETHRRNHQAIRLLEEETGRPVGILVDLQGPKLRIGRFAEDSIVLEEGNLFRLDRDPQPGDSKRVQLPHPEILSALSAGTSLLLDDGRLRLCVVEADADSALTRVEIGGTLSNNKGINLPGVEIPLSPLTEKDRNDLDYALQLGVDWVALSFVQRPEDMQELRKIVDGRAKILAKIEKPGAIEQLDGIISESDGVMVARGDLGIEIPPENVPPIQKRILRKCRRAGVAVIVATQMLESMIKSPLPTRAEAADVATAIYDGADAVMLSGETAVGEYVVDSVSVMNGIIAQVEKDPYYRTITDSVHPGANGTTADAICCAMRRVAGVLPVSATVTFTSSGFTAVRSARERPEAPILGLSPNTSTLRRLTLFWGIHGVKASTPGNIEEMVKQACELAVHEEFSNPGKAIVLIGGMPFGKAGTTNLLRIVWPESDWDSTEVPDL